MLVPEDVRDVFVETVAHRIFLDPVYQLRREQILPTLRRRARHRACAITGGEDIAYRPRCCVSGVRFGAHPSPGAGALGAFRDHVPFMAYPDARRIDVRATLRHPFGNTFVRRFQQRASIDLYALVDLTRSLAYQGRASKMELITALCVALARSATRMGDRFGLIGCDAGVRPDCFIPATKRRGVAEEAAALLGRARCEGASAPA